MDAPATFHRTLPLLLVAYGAASLFHHVHNAEFLADYPSLPAWLSRTKVYLAWLCVTAVGLFGYVLVRRGYRLAGLAAIALYAFLGFDGLAHYGLAPLSAHSLTMNVSIGMEVATAGLLLAAAATQALATIRDGQKQR